MVDNFIWARIWKKRPDGNYSADMVSVSHSALQRIHDRNKELDAENQKLKAALEEAIEKAKKYKAALNKIAGFYINKEGMTGGHCVEIAQQVLK